MSFNYAREKRKFNMEQQRLAEEYTSAGMSEEAIAALYALDWKWFCRCRVYARHNVRLPETEYMDEKGYSTLIREFAGMSVTPNFEDDLEHFDWLDTIENEKLYRRLCSLTNTDLKLLTLLVKEGCTQKEAAKRLACAESSVCKRLKKIRKKLSEV